MEVYGDTLDIIVDVNGHGDFASINEAVQNTGAESINIELKKGIYYEKVMIKGKSKVKICGEGMSDTIIIYNDGGFDMMPDGQKRGTFNSYTAYFECKYLKLSNLSIINAAGDGRVHGQSIAAYFDSRLAECENCAFDSCQDTLFLAPLPDKEREKGGFRGPGEFNKRLMTESFFTGCYITGDVDFIFGGGTAAFSGCRINSKDRGAGKNKLNCENSDIPEVNGYVAAPSGKKGTEGFVFERCGFISDGAYAKKVYNMDEIRKFCSFEESALMDYFRVSESCAPQTVYLARPWRPDGRALFSRCFFGEHIKKEAFSGWFKNEKVSENFRIDG
jgi:pectinesterase